MKEGLTSLERKVLAVLQRGLPRSRNPYRDLAKQIGIETEQLLSMLRSWKRNGKLRRIGAIVNHFKVGLGAGAMVVWRVEPERVDEIGRGLASLEQISHAYCRRTAKNWPYNLYAMVHGRTAQEVRGLVEQIEREHGVSDYCILRTVRELKKAPPTYVTTKQGMDDKSG